MSHEEKKIHKDGEGENHCHVMGSGSIQVEIRQMVWNKAEDVKSTVRQSKRYRVRTGTKVCKGKMSWK